MLTLPVSPQLGRASSPELAAQVLREWITHGQLPPGARLSEVEICEALKVSRNTLREAFRLLSRERLVIHEFHRGVFVRTLTAADVTDLYAVRELAERGGIRAAPSATQGRRAAVRRAVEDGERAASCGDWSAVATADLAFHRSLAALIGSVRVDEWMTGVLAELRLAFAVVPDATAFHLPFLARNGVLASMLEQDRFADAEVELCSYLAAARAQLLVAMGAPSDHPHQGADNGSAD